MNPRGNDPRRELTFPCSWFDKVGIVRLSPTQRGAQQIFAKWTKISSSLLSSVASSCLEHTGWVGRILAEAGTPHRVVNHSGSSDLQEAGRNPVNSSKLNSSSGNPRKAKLNFRSPASGPLSEPV